jgi:hypothetical protein
MVTQVSSGSGASGSGGQGAQSALARLVGSPWARFDPLAANPPTSESATGVGRHVPTIGRRGGHTVLSIARPASVIMNQITSIVRPLARIVPGSATANPAERSSFNSARLNPCANIFARVRPCRVSASNRSARHWSSVSGIGPAPGSLQPEQPARDLLVPSRTAGSLRPTGTWVHDARLPCWCG